MIRTAQGRAPDDADWDAFVQRRVSGHVSGPVSGNVWAVVTTGIHCCDGCPGRPLRKNLRIFPTRAAAEAAGFRACKRCGGGGP